MKRFAVTASVLPAIAGIALGGWWGGYSQIEICLGMIAYLLFIQVMRPWETEQKVGKQLRDYYVVTDDTYNWDITREHRPNPAITPKTGGEIFAFDNVDAALIKYRELDAEHPDLDLSGHDLSYHENFGYDEMETRLWVVQAASKGAAYDKVWDEDSRRLLGYGQRSEDVLLLITDNQARRRTYIDWWHNQHKLAREALS